MTNKEVDFPVEGFEPEPEVELPDEYLSNADESGIVIDPRTDPLNSRGLQPNEKALKILLETDEIPERVSDIMWATSSRHLELIDVNEFDMADYDIMIRDLHRHARWSREARKISPLDLKQSEFFAGKVLLPKSKDRGERTLIATQITRNVVDQNNAEKNEKGEQKRGLFQSAREMIGL